MIVPAANAYLKAVTTAGFSDDYDVDETAGTLKWQGWQGVRIDVKTLRKVPDQGGGDVTVARYRTVTASADLGFDYAEGDVLTIETRTGVSETFEVTGIAAEPSEMPGVPRYAVLETKPVAG